MIDVEELGRDYGQRAAVSELTFSAGAGEVVGLLGPNGAGKTTTMRMIAGYIAPSRGRVTVAGIDMARAPLRAQRVLGYLPEGAPSYGDMRVLSFLRFVARVRGLRGKRQRQCIGQVVEQLSLGPVLGQRIDTLSKGYKRRVGLAQALLHDPAVLVLDEPTDGLDPNQKRQVRALIRRLASEKTILLSTHILEEVSALCTRVLVIAQGRLVADEQPAVLAARSRYRGAVTLSLVDPGRLMEPASGEDVAQAEGVVADRLAVLPGVAGVERDPLQAGRVTVFPLPGAGIVAPVLSTIEREGWQVAELQTEGGRLDDVFYRLTAAGQAALAG